MAKNILPQLCSRILHLKPFLSGAGQKGRNSLGMACLERVESFLIIKNKMSSYGSVYKLEYDSVTCYFSSMSCDTRKWPLCSPVASARGGCVRLHAHEGIWLPQVLPVFPVVCFLQVPVFCVML